MSERLLLVNPSKTRRRTATKKRSPKKMARAKRKARRTPAQRANDRRLGLMAKRRARGRKATRRVSRAPARRRRRNPMPAAKRRAYRAVRTAYTPIRRRRRRNPSSARARFRDFGTRLLLPSVAAAGGALAMDWIWANLPMIPADLRTGRLKYAAKGATTIGAWWLLNWAKIGNQKTIDAMGVGAFTVLVYGIGRDFIAQMAPTVKMDGLGYYNAGLPVGGYGAHDMGLYVGNQSLPQMPGNNMGLYVGNYDAESTYYSNDM